MDKDGSGSRNYNRRQHMKMLQILEGIVFAFRPSAQLRSAIMDSVSRCNNGQRKQVETEIQIARMKIDICWKPLRDLSKVIA